MLFTLETYNFFSYLVIYKMEKKPYIIKMAKVNHHVIHNLIQYIPPKTTNYQQKKSIAQ